MEIDWAVEADYPDAVDFNRFFGDLVVDSTYTIPLRIMNLGIDDLVIDSIFCNVPYISTDTLQMHIEPQRNATLNLTFQTDTLLQIDGQITLLYNDRFEREFDIQVRASTELFVDDDDLQPLQFALDDPIPNPFNSSSTIRYQLPYSMQIDLALFDLNGRRVKNLSQGLYPAGEHSVVLNGSDMASGVYIVLLRGGDVDLKRKLVLVR